MTDKRIIHPSPSSLSQKEEEQQHISKTTAPFKKEQTAGFVPAVLRLDEKIQQLKKKKERLQTQQALLFVKEVQKIFKEIFIPDVALVILSETWSKASESQKAEWKKRGHSFRLLPSQHRDKKAHPNDQAHHEN